MSLKQRFIFIPVIILLCAAAFILFGYLSVRRSVPPESGSFPAPGLERQVEIGRDEWGVVHIDAGSEYDLYFAAGYSCAQDRLWEMDFLRRAATGRLAEILGPELVEVDLFTRTIGFGRLGRRLLPVLPSATAANLRAYCAGINTYIATARQLPLEFGALRYTPEPWQPEESLACMRLIGWLLSMGWNIDLVYAETAAKVDSQKFVRILPEALPGLRSFPLGVDESDSTAAAPLKRRSRMDRFLRSLLPLPSLDSLRRTPLLEERKRDSRRGEPVSAVLRQGEEGLRRLFNSPSGGLGSNAWVINGRLTERGQALLANDTHLVFTVPSLYYLMHLHSPAVNAVGAAFPGLPGLVVGRNEFVGWGITNGMVDDVDLVRLEPDSIDAEYYRFGRQRYRYIYHDETIAIRGGEEKKVRIPWSHIGPVISAATPILGYRGEDPLVLRWSGFENDDPLTAFQELMTARDWGGFLAALESSKNPGENFFYADRAGQIGYKLAAAVPRRTYRDAIVPLPERTAVPDSLASPDSLAREARVRDWLGFIPFTQLPQLFQPSSGWIANANNCMVDTTYAHFISVYWEPDYRYNRIKAALDTLSRWNLASCRALQADLYSGHAAAFVPLLMKAIQHLDLPRNQPADFGRELLSVWDYQQTTSSVASTVYEMTLNEFMRLTFADEMGEELYQRFVKLSHVNVRVLDRLIALNDSLWFDDVRTPGLETLDSQLAAAFYAAIDSLTLRYGDNPGMWDWGSVHTLTQPHPFGRHTPFRRYFNIGPAPSAGGNHTLNNSTYSMAEPFATIIGPCVRQISDMSTSEWHVILPAGQSGHPFSRHYRDQHPLWQEGEMITLQLHSLTRRNPRWNWQILRPVSANSRP